MGGTDMSRMQKSELLILLQGITTLAEEPYISRNILHCLREEFDVMRNLDKQEITGTIIHKESLYSFLKTKKKPNKQTTTKNTPWHIRGIKGPGGETEIEKIWKMLQSSITKI